MATVTKPVALDESLNTTDSTPKNIADVLKDKLGDIASAISGGGGGSGGHTIQNASGANMPQEPTMQFTDSHVSDDSTNEKTKVEVIKSVASADYSSETEDGLYLIPDGDGSVIEPASDDYVEVTADGVKTYATLLNELYALIDSTKLTDNSYIDIFDGFFRISNIYGGVYYFEASFAGAKLYCDTLKISQSGSLVKNWETTTNGSTYSESASTQVPSNGTKITLYYGNKKAVVDLQTTANRCWYDSNNTVKQKIDGFSTVISSVENATSTAASTGIPIGCRYILAEMRYESSGVKQVYASSFIPVLKDDTERFLVYNNANVSFTIYSNGNVTYKCSNSAVSNSYIIKLYFIK